MANSPQARKRARQADKKKLHNNALESELRTYIKATKNAAAANDSTLAKENQKKMVAKIDRLAGNNVIHPNRAARLKSRINAMIKKIVD